MGKDGGGDLEGLRGGLEVLGVVKGDLASFIYLIVKIVTVVEYGMAVVLIVWFLVK